MTDQDHIDAIQPSDDDTAPVAPPPQEPRSRRSFLGVAAAALGGFAVQSVAAVTPVAASNGSTVKAGVETTETTVTTIRNTKSAGVALKGYASSTTTSSSSTGILGQSGAPSGTGVRGVATNTGGTGVVGTGSSQGVRGSASVLNGTGVYGVADSGTNAWGVGGSSATGKGVYGSSSGNSGSGVYGSASGSGYSAGVRGFGGHTGVEGTVTSNGTIGVAGYASGQNGVGLYGRSTGQTGTAIYGSATGPDGSLAADFNGNVRILGAFSASTKAFRIDHPVDPANRYLAHACVESPEMLNVYSGTVQLDGRGRATVRLPRYFEMLNMEHRYQLTAIGSPAPTLHVAKEIEKNRFVIAGGIPGQKVCWLITGVRQDAYAKKHRIKVDTPKSAKDKGKYLNPDAFGKRRTDAIGYRKPSKAAKQAKAEAKPFR